MIFACGCLFGHWGVVVAQKTQGRALFGREPKKPQKNLAQH